MANNSSTYAKYRLRIILKNWVYSCIHPIYLKVLYILDIYYVPICILGVYNTFLCVIKKNLINVFYHKLVVCAMYLISFDKLYMLLCQITQ
jgi:hypothetical protein